MKENFPYFREKMRLFQFDGFRCIYSSFENSQGNPCISHIMFCRSFREPISQTFPYDGLFPFLPFPMLWESDEKTRAFPIWWSIPQDKNLMEKASILRKKHGNQFSRLYPYDGFCCIFPFIGSWCENPCISHMMRLVNLSCLSQMGIL